MVSSPLACEPDEDSECSPVTTAAAEGRRLDWIGPRQLAPSTLCVSPLFLQAMFTIYDRASGYAGRLARSIFWLCKSARTCGKVIPGHLQQVLSLV